MDVEAEVDEDEEDFEEDEEELGKIDGFIQDQNYEDSGAHDDRLHREVDRRRDAIHEEDAERLADEYREKYGRSAVSKYRGDSNVVSQRLLLPSVNDPNIWGVRCKYGKEKELVRAILKKKISLQHSAKPLEIYSCFQRDGFNGYIYIEARRPDAVEYAVRGLVNVYIQNKIMVPVKEYTDLLRAVKRNDVELVPGTYVRVKRGKYTGDLAVVENLSENGLEAQLRLMPRLDYGKFNNDENGIDGEKRKRPTHNAKVRPQQRLFSEQEASQYDLKNLQRRGRNSFYYKSDLYENGYLIKDFKITFLETKDVNPRLEELTKINSTTDEGIDLQSLAHSLKQSSSAVTFQPGEKVSVVSGEQNGLHGRVYSSQADIVTIIVDSPELKGKKIDIPMVNLRKMFRVGDHVRVISGKHKDDTGLVLEIANDQIIFVSDLSQNEITVFSNYLVEASDSGGINSVGQYELHDLVQLSSQLVGCIVKAEREAFTVLCQDGALKTVAPTSISFKIDKNKESFATDRSGSDIRVGDTVKEISGERRQGVILHIYRSSLFLHSRTITENLGVFVTDTSKVNTIAAKGARIASSGPDLNKMNPKLQINQGNMGAPMNIPRQGGRDRTLNQHVVVRLGPYKGMKGIVKDASDAVARVELHSKNRIISINKEKLSFLDPNGKLLSYEEFVVPRRGMRDTSVALTQFNGSATPSWGGFGGNGGGKTPAWATSGGKTPAWASGGRTPAFGSGGRTPAFNAGGRTPAFNSGSRTPAFGNDGRTPAWSSGGGKTPVWSSGATGRSSAWEPNVNSSWDAAPSSRSGGSWYDAKTPGFNEATTPGIPTPGIPTLSAPTPGASTSPEWSAATPGVFDAKTPGIAPTPAAWNPDDDDDVHYVPDTP